MKKLLMLSVILSLGFLITSLTRSDETKELKWMTDLEKAHELSEKTGKPIFGFFTGSDWCGWCHKLQRDVFDKEAFIDWASESVILLELDFPKRKVLTPELKKQNQELQQAFGVRGYPTVWIFNTDKDKKTGQISLAAMGKLGYMANEAVFIKQADKIMTSEK